MGSIMAVFVTLKDVLLLTSELFYRLLLFSLSEIISNNGQSVVTQGFGHNTHGAFIVDDALALGAAYIAILFGNLVNRACQLVI